MQVCSTDESESEIIIVNKSSTEESEPESVHKIININKGKYAIDETDHEAPPVTDYPVINEPSFFNLFKCRKIYIEQA